MAEVGDYAPIVRRILAAYAAIKPSLGDISVELVCDEAGGHYELMQVGWIDHRRIHGSVIHVDIRGDKVWIQHDGTEHGIASDLIEAGIPKDHIVLGFHAPYKRQDTDFALG